MALSNKQIAFAEEYIVCWNSAEAARRAGYSERTARSIGSENLTKPDIKAYIAARLSELKMTADEVLVRLARIGRANIADFAHVASGNDLRELGDDATVVKKFKRKITRDNKTETEYEELELELYPADVNLERIGKHLGLFVERHSLELHLEKEVDAVLNVLEEMLPSDDYQRILARLSGSPESQGQAAKASSGEG